MLELVREVYQRRRLFDVSEAGHLNQHEEQSLRWFDDQVANDAINGCEASLLLQQV